MKKNIPVPIPTHELRNKCLTQNTIESPTDVLYNTLTDIALKLRINPITKDVDIVLPPDSPIQEDTRLASREEAYNNPKRYPINLNPGSTWSMKRVNLLKSQVEQELRSKRLFVIDEPGHFEKLRLALTQRGWLEKKDSPKRPRHLALSSTKKNSVQELCEYLPPRLQDEDFNTYYEKCVHAIISKMLENQIVNFYWTTKREDSTIYNNVLRNRLAQAPFVSKDGLAKALEHKQWSFEAGIAETYTPRCYSVSQAEEFEDFINDYHITACTGFLKYISDSLDKRGQFAIQRAHGNVPLYTIKFAIKRCTEYVDLKNHEDIDHEYVKVSIYEWEKFLKHHNSLINLKGMFCMDSPLPLTFLCADIKSTLSRMAAHCPQMKIDGYRNIWIIKPINGSRGHDISMVRTIEDVIDRTCIFQAAPKMQYVVQKYFESPFIIYDTKFDIRQWFLVVSVSPLIIWMYKESYLRFSSQKYDLCNLNESVHLTNNAIQKNYENGPRSVYLPKENMWDSVTFQNYLKKIGKHNEWQSIVYPGMKKSIIGVLLSSLDKLDVRLNSFELFGADFMLDEDLKPWLIEINSSPDMNSTTSVTKRMCAECLEDVVKVVIDAREDSKADKGKFECIFTQRWHSDLLQTINLTVQGKKILASGESPDVSLVKEEENDNSQIMQGHSSQNFSRSRERLISKIMSAYYTDKETIAAATAAKKAEVVNVMLSPAKKSNFLTTFKSRMLQDAKVHKDSERLKRIKKALVSAEQPTIKSKYWNDDEIIKNKTFVNEDMRRKTPSSVWNEDKFMELLGYKQPEQKIQRGIKKYTVDVTKTPCISKKTRKLKKKKTKIVGKVKKKTSGKTSTSPDLTVNRDTSNAETSKLKAQHTIIIKQSGTILKKSLSQSTVKSEKKRKTKRKRPGTSDSTKKTRASIDLSYKYNTKPVNIGEDSKHSIFQILYKKLDNKNMCT